MSCIILLVLTYHRVDGPEDRPWLDPSSISATPEAFDEQMGYLGTRYRPITIRDVVSTVETRNSTALPSRAVVVTFDNA